MKTFKTNFGIVELCLTYRCNIHCNNCSNLCTQAPFKGDLFPSDVQNFLVDIDKNNIKVGQITLHGGEPVLNPNIEEIIIILCQYRVMHNTTLWLLTNNSCQSIRQKTTKISCDYDIPLGVATKIEGNQIPYVPVNESPEDINEKFTLGCFQTENCGICFNYLGYFPCSPIAAAARVFGYKGVEYISQLTEEKCKEYFNIHCKHCGFSMPDRRRVIEQTSSKTWLEKLDIYNKEREKI